MTIVALEEEDFTESDKNDFLSVFAEGNYSVMPINS